MFYLQNQNANGSVIAVTSAATSLYSLINTAASTTLDNAGYSFKANGLNILPEDGDVRILFDSVLSPTSTKGMLLTQGTQYFFRNVPLDKMKLIRTGGSNVSCSIGVGICESSEVTTAVAGVGSTAIVEAVDVTKLGGISINLGLGAVSTGTQRVVLGTNTHTYAETTVGDSATSVSLLAANSARGMATVRNGSTAAMYISKTATATSSSPVKVSSGGIYELPIERNGDVYKGALTAIWDSDAGGSAYVEESTIS